MNRKVVFWLEPNQSLVPVDQIPGAIAEAKYPLPDRNEAEGQPLNDPDTVLRLQEERAQLKKLCEKFPNLPGNASFTIGDLRNYLDALGLKASFMTRQPHGVEIPATIPDAVKPPEQQAEQLIAWYDSTLDASLWFGLASPSPREAAMLLSQFNPNDEKLDPLEVFNTETCPDDYKKLQRVFEDVANTESKPRPLMLWLAIAKEKGLKYHSWIDKYVQATQIALPANDLEPDPQRCSILASMDQLSVSEWEELTGIGIGEDNSYTYGQAGIFPKKYSDVQLRLMCADERRTLLQASSRLPLQFPCSPGQLIAFVDDDRCHDFELPESFRIAVASLYRINRVPLQSGTSKQRSEPAWKAKARSLGDAYIKAWREAGYAPTKQDAALYVEGVLFTEGTHGEGRKEVIDRAYIERHALKGITGKRPGEKSKRPKVPDTQRGQLPNFK